MRIIKRFSVGLITLLLLFVDVSHSTTILAEEASNEVVGWLGWRGPDQNASSTENSLPDNWVVGGENHVWDISLKGRGTPVIANDRLYALGYVGEAQEMREVIKCLDASTGKLIWEYYYNDFLSDVIYSRYSIGAPTVDAETGNVYVLSTAGVTFCFDRNGKKLWELSLFEDFGRIPSLPNGRTGAPAIDGDLVIVRGVSSNWGKIQGPGRDRLLALNKKTGEHVWTCTPGIQPVDSSFSTPVFAWYKNKRVMYVGTGCGHMACINVKTGQTLWRYRLSTGGVNSSLILFQNKTLVGIHGKGNPNSSRLGGLVGIELQDRFYESKEPVVLEDKDVAWRHEVMMFTSSPALDKDKLYQVDKKGDLHCISVTSGEKLWVKDLGVDQIHASPLCADGKIYVGMTNGDFYILKPGETDAEVLCKQQLQGGCLGAPAIYAGRIYIHTKEKLYCFGSQSARIPKQKVKEKSQPQIGSAVALQIFPTELVLQPGDKIAFTAYSIDADGHRVEKIESAQLSWKKHPKLPISMNAGFTDQGELLVEEINNPSAGVFVATYKGLSGSIRGRVLNKLPFRVDFESMKLSQKRETEDMGSDYSHPPSSWLGARMKWEVRELEGNKVFTKTLFNLLFTKARSFIGPAYLKDYTVEADIMSEGNRRVMSDVGVINQRYNIALVGNAQVIRVTSNHDRFKQELRYKWSARTWYRIKTKIEKQSDGSALVRVKVWPRSENEPEEWTFSPSHRYAHTHGAPGLFGFAPQAKKRVYIDNVSVYANIKK